MERITEEQLRWLTETQLTDITLKCADGKKAEIEPRLFVTINWQEVEERAKLAENGEEFEPVENRIECGGFTTTYDKTEHKSKNYDTLLKYLKKIGAVTKDGIKLSSISGEYNTLKKYKAHCDFMSLDNAGIIEKYASVADEFELVAPYCPYSTFDREHPDGTVKLSDEDANAAIAKIRKQTEDVLHSRYEKLTAKQKAALPPFEELCDEITEESREHRKKTENDLLDGESPFLCDLVYRGKVKYPKPESAMWHFYHEIDMLGSFYETARNMQSNPEERPLDCNLDFPELTPLKPHLISVTPTFTWHCTTSGMLYKVFRFKLNDETLAWLKAGNYGELEDLAFYKGDKILYSECTHEGIRTDFTN